MSRIQDLIRHTRQLERKMAALKVEYDANRLKIQEYFDEKNIKKLEVEVESSEADFASTITATKVERITIEYMIPELKKKLSKGILEEVIQRAYYIKDIEKLKYALRSRGVSGEEFRLLVGVNESVDKDRIKQLYSIGDIKQAHLNGCYTATISKSIQLKERKRGDKN